MKLKEEDKFKIVLTTKFVLVNGAPITFVLYDEDGDWQLFSEDEITEDEDPYTVTVEEILEMEPALKQLPRMEKGQGVVREAGTTRWFFAEDEE